MILFIKIKTLGNFSYLPKMHSHLTMSEYWKVTINFSFVINTTDSYAFFSSHHLSLPFCPYPSLFHIFCSLSRTTSVSILSKILYLHLLLIICLCFIGFYPISYCLFVKIFIPPEIFQMFRIIFLHFLICLVHFLVRKMESFLDLTFLFSFINRFAILRTFSEVTLTKKLLYQHKLWTDHILFSL